MMNSPQVVGLLLALTMGLSGCFSAPLSADAVAPTLPPLSQTGLGADGTSGPGDSEPGSSWYPICTMVSARQEAGQEREYREVEKEEEPNVIHTPGPPPNASSDTLVVLDVGDEDWIRLQIQAPNHIEDEKRDEWFASRGQAFKAAIDYREKADGKIQLIEGETQIDEDAFVNITEDGLVIEFRIRATKPGNIDISALLLTEHPDDPSYENWIDCAGEPTWLTYHVNPEA